MSKGLVESVGDRSQVMKGIVSRIDGNDRLKEQLFNLIKDNEADMKALSVKIKRGIKQTNRLKNQNKKLKYGNSNNNIINNNTNGRKSTLDQLPLCNYWMSGKCKYGNNCHWSHGTYVKKSNSSSSSNISDSNNKNGQGDIISFTPITGNSNGISINGMAVHESIEYARKKELEYRRSNYVRPLGPRARAVKLLHKIYPTLPTIAANPAKESTSPGDVCSSEDNDIVCTRPTKRARLLGGIKATAHDVLPDRIESNMDDNNKQNGGIAGVGTGKVNRTFGGLNTGKRKTTAIKRGGIKGSKQRGKKGGKSKKNNKKKKYK